MPGQKGSGALFLETGKRTLFDCMKVVETKEEKKQYPVFEKGGAVDLYSAVFTEFLCVLDLSARKYDRYELPEDRTGQDIVCRI